MSASWERGEDFLREIDGSGSKDFSEASASRGYSVSDTAILRTLLR